MQISLAGEGTQIPDTALTKSTKVTFTGHYGFIMAHNPNMANLIKKHIGAGEVYLIRQTTGEKKWERIYRNPEKGVGFFYAELGNPEQLGQGLGLFPFVNLPINPDAKFRIHFRIGNGIGLITKPYERLLNHKNHIIGTYLNEFIYLRFNSVFFPFPKFRMEAGIGISHLSNGLWAVPNLGINMITANIGFSVWNKDHEPQPKPYANYPHDSVNRKWVHQIIFAAGVNELNYRNGPKYPTYALAYTAWKQVAHKSRFGGGTDMFYSVANLVKAEQDSLFDYTRKLNNVQAGIRGAYELVIGKFSLPIEMGAYVITKFTIRGPLYHRIGVRYRVNKHLVLNYTLKSHWATAENIEFGIGLLF